VRHRMAMNSDVVQSQVIVFLNQVAQNQGLLILIKGTFNPCPLFIMHLNKPMDIRKNCERPFNLMKTREGLETTRVRSQHGVVARSAFTTIVTLMNL